MDIVQTKIQDDVDAIFDLYEQHGQDDYIGEPVSQIEHMSQSAALAQSEGYDDEVVLAAFFHDIGHLCASHGEDGMSGFGASDHENIGSEYLKKYGFSDRLIKLVKSHVSAKRYLTFKYPDYYHKLSEASKATLVFQGGMMLQQEATEFEADPDFNLMLRFRQWDDIAKAIDIPVVNIIALKEKTVKHLINRQRV